MSAIWGAIDLNERSISEATISAMKSPFETCKIDRIREINGENFYLACGIQFFTSEAEFETLPMHNVENGSVFTADVIVDNRNEIAEALGLDKCDGIPDGELLEKMICQEGEKALSKILGAFSFVCYEQRGGKVTLAVDSVGTRCLYYYFEDSIVYFSTLLEAFENLEKRPRLNEEVIIDYLNLDNNLIRLDPESTYLEDVYLITAGQVITITSDTVTKRDYWRPDKDVKEIKLENDQAYSDLFNSTFDAIISSMLRSNGSTGMLLSSGFDSTAVFCKAVRCLKEKNEILYTFTAAPDKSYDLKESRIWLPDESDLVLKTLENYDNVEPMILRLESQHPWYRSGELVKCFELPTKSMMNTMWILDSLKEAREKGVRIMLSGNHGNMSISSGDVWGLLSDYLIRFKFISLWREITSVSVKHSLSRKKLLKKVLINEYRARTMDFDRFFERSYANVETNEEWKSTQRITAHVKHLYSIRKYKIKKKRMSAKYYLSASGEFQTKCSLRTGVLQRDPTKDKRMLELCLSFPHEQFVKDGDTRRLVRIYMNDVMPEHVLNCPSRGRQSSDLANRTNEVWEELRDEWLQLYAKFSNERFVDVEKAIADLKQQGQFDLSNDHNINRHMSTLNVAELVYNKFPLQSSKKP